MDQQGFLLSERLCPALLGQQSLSGQTGHLLTPREVPHVVHPAGGLRVDTEENML